MDMYICIACIYCRKKKKRLNVVVWKIDRMQVPNFNKIMPIKTIWFLAQRQIQKKRTISLFISGRKMIKTIECANCQLIKRQTENKFKAIVDIICMSVQAIEPSLSLDHTSLAIVILLVWLWVCCMCVVFCWQFCALSTFDVHTFVGGPLIHFVCALNFGQLPNFWFKTFELCEVSLPVKLI